MASIFTGPEKVDVPTKSDKEIEEERRRQLKERTGSGRAGTLLTGGGGITAPILGSAASLVGGV
jgi:hypothetical protein